MNFFQRRLEKLEQEAAALEGEEAGYWVHIIFPACCFPEGVEPVLKCWKSDKE
jgi:hypothetical protein